MGTNLPLPLDLAVVHSTRVNRSAIEAVVAELPGRRTVKKTEQAAACVLATRTLDLTTLSSDDTDKRISRLVAKARNPVRADLLAALGFQSGEIKVGAVCVYPRRVADAVRYLQGSGIPVASVATGFSDGQILHAHKLREIEAAIRDGAVEIDVVISRDYVLTANWRALYDEICEFRTACGPSIKMKVILETGVLGTYENVAKAAAVAIMAGADTIKTSTGKAPVNATLEVGLVMAWQIRRFRDELSPGRVVGFKPAGGIREAKNAYYWLILMLEELGPEWTLPDRLRLGASPPLLIDIERQFSHLITGRYAARHHMALA